MSLFLGDARDELKCHAMQCLQLDEYKRRRGMDGPVMYYASRQSFPGPRYQLILFKMPPRSCIVTPQLEE
jgi:hypothetical protein